MSAIAFLAAALLGIFACSIPAVRRIGLRTVPAQRFRYQPDSERYEDEDGTATQESEAAYSYHIPRMVVLLISVLGFSASSALGVITARSHRTILAAQQWLLFAAWVCSDRFSKRRNFVDRLTRLSS